MPLLENSDFQDSCAKSRINNFSKVCSATSRMFLIVNLMEKPEPVVTAKNEFEGRVKNLLSVIFGICKRENSRRKDEIR